MTGRQDLIAAVNDDDAARVAELARGRPGPRRPRATATACRRSCCRATGSTAATTDALLAADPDLDVFEATALGYIDRLRERLDEDPARATAYSADGFTALHFAAFFGKAEAARTLHRGRRRGRRRTRPTRSRSSRSTARPPGRHLEVCRLLIAAGADVNATQRHGFTPLHAAAQHGDVELVELFLSAGADPTGPTDDGETPGRHRRGGGPRRRRAAAPRGRRQRAAADRRRRSAALEVALALPGVDDRVVGLLLDPGRVEVVVDDVLAEDLDRRLGPLELARSPRTARAASASTPVAR